MGPVRIVLSLRDGPEGSSSPSPRFLPDGFQGVSEIRNCARKTIAKAHVDRQVRSIAGRFRRSIRVPAAGLRVDLPAVGDSLPLGSLQPLEAYRLPPVLRRRVDRTRAATFSGRVRVVRLQL